MAKVDLIHWDRAERALAKALVLNGWGPSRRSGPSRVKDGKVLGFWGKRISGSPTYITRENREGVRQTDFSPCTSITVVSQGIFFGTVVRYG